MGAQKRPRNTKHDEKLTTKSAKLRKTGKHGGFKRIGKASKADGKKHTVYDKRFPTETDESEELYEEQVDEHSEGGEAELVANTEPTMYDSLLKKLGSRNSDVADALRRRQREEQGETDSDEDEDSDPESVSELEEKDDDDEDDDDDDDDGNNSKSPRSYNVGEDVNPVELSEDAGTDDYDAISDTDEEDTSGVYDQSLSEASISNFDNHLSYKLTCTEVDLLLKRKWKYTWKMPALNMSNCHWRGTGECFIKDPETKSYYGLKPKLYKHWLESYKASGSSDFHQSKQRSFFSICSSYFDIMHHNKKPFYLKGLEEDSNIMDTYLMHSLNHIFKSRDLIVKNERKLAKNQESVESRSVDDDAYRDRGFTRPKVLILLPLAGIMRRVVKRLIQLTPTKHKATVENLERFCEEFGSGRTESNLEDDDLEIPKPKSSGKPPDFQALLGRDDANDHFMIGIKYTNRGIKLYGDFYTSDMIIASPLGLITKIGEAEVVKEKDVDYLSSIEILIIDHADVMLMQNWSHVNTVAEQLNRLPSKQHGADVMRLRPWYLDGQARFYRQTVILGSHTNPEMNAFMNQHCLNYRGKVKLECTYKGVLPKILIQARQIKQLSPYPTMCEYMNHIPPSASVDAHLLVHIYERFDIESIAEADNDRLKYFCEKVFPKIKDSVQNGVMIFVSSYFEFVRLRNYLKSQSASFCLFGEYVKRNEISRVRGEFFRGEKKSMLYSERAHFYYRYKIRGVKNLIIYSLPERKEFYPEIVNMLEESDCMNCRVLFSRLDHLRLERIVGSAAAKRMIGSDKGVFVFA